MANWNATSGRIDSPRLEIILSIILIGILVYYSKFLLIFVLFLSALSGRSCSIIVIILSDKMKWIDDIPMIFHNPNWAFGIRTYQIILIPLTMLNGYLIDGFIGLIISFIFPLSILSISINYILCQTNEDEYLITSPAIQWLISGLVFTLFTFYNVIFN